LAVSFQRGFLTHWPGNNFIICQCAGFPEGLDVGCVVSMW